MTDPRKVGGGRSSCWQDAERGAPTCLRTTSLTWPVRPEPPLDADGDDKTWQNVAISDYLAIGPCVPCRMVRKERFKYMFTYGQPDLMFDLVADPDELEDLAAAPDYAATLAELRRIAFQDYDPEALMSEVIASQRRRRFIATIPGTTPSWDYVAYQGDADRYVRRDGVDATKSRPPAKGRKRDS